MTPAVYNALAALKTALIGKFTTGGTALTVGNCIITLASVSLPHMNRLYVEIMDSGGNFPHSDGGAMERSGRFKIAIRNKLAVANLGQLSAFSKELLNFGEQVRAFLHNNPAFGFTDLPQIDNEIEPRLEDFSGADGQPYVEAVIEQTFTYVITLDYGTFSG